MTNELFNGPCNEMDITILARGIYVCAGMTLAAQPPTRLPVLPGKSKRVAIVGAGLSGLTAATDLAKKGYGVAVFEASEKLGGSLWTYPEAELPREVIERDLDMLKQLTLDIHFGSALGRDISLSGLEAEFDAIYLGSEAAQEASRCLQCECMECVKVCDYLETFKAYPRKYVRQIYNNLSIIAGQRHGNLMINSCSLWGLCKEVCPDDLHMGEVCKTARETMVAQERMPPSAHDFALRDMELSNSEYFVLARHQPSTESSAFVFFPGCQLSASSPENVKKTYAYLREELEGDVGLLLRCCGAPADWSGRTELFSQTLGDFETEWKKLGSPALILGCSTCHSVFGRRLPQEKIVSLWEVIDGIGLPGIGRKAHAGPVAVHDPCTARHEPQIQTSVRNLLRKLGCEVRELTLSRDKTECCSFGGLMYFANRDEAEKVIRRRIEETTDDLLAYCAMCRDRYASEGKPTWHLLDLIFGEDASGDVSGKGPDYSQRRENRARLKRSLLSELWSEETVKHEDYQDIKLEIDDRVRELMEKRMILVEDLQQVIQWAEKTGRRLVNRETGNFLAQCRPGTVTYWVEYSPGQDGYVIHNAYSHRMEIVEEI